MNRIITSIKYRKYKYLLIVFMLLINTILSTVVHSILSNTENKIRNFYYDKYGEHHSVFFSLNAGAVRKLDNDHGIQKGYFYNLSTMSLEDSEQLYTFGYFDKNAMALGHIRLIKGRLPENKSEIAVEQITLEKRFPEGTSLGDTIHFKDENGNLIPFIITGIISDYRGEWNYSKWINVTPGRNAYPSVICHPDIRSEKMQTNALVKFNNILDNGYAYITTTDMYFSSGDHAQIDSFSTALNENMYSWVTERIFSFYNLFKLIIYIMICISSGAVVFIASLNLCQDYLNSFRLYDKLGASSRFKYTTINLELLSVIIITSFIRMIVFFYIERVPLLLFCADIAILIIFINLYLHFNTADHIWRYIKRYVSRLISRRREKHKTEHTATNEHLLLKKIFGKANTRLMIPSIIVLSIIISCFVISSFYSSEIKELFSLDSYDFMLDNLGYGMIFAHNIIYASEIDTSVAYEKILELYELNGIKNIYIQYVPTGGILVRKHDPFWDYISTTNLEDVLENTELINNLPEEVDSTVLDFTYFVVTDDMEQMLKKRYPDFPFSQIRDNDSIVLLSPEIILDDKSLINTSYTSGDTLTFGMLKYINPKNKYIAFVSPTDLSYEELDLEIAKSYNDEGFLDKFPLNNDVGIVIHENTVKELKLDLKASLIQVWLNDDITEKDYIAIENKFAELMKFSVNSIYYSKRDNLSQQQQLINVVNKSLIINMCTYGIYSVFAIYSIFRLNLMNRKRSLGIMRSMGLNSSFVRETQFREVFEYMICLILLTSLLVAFIFNRIWSLPNIIAPRFIPTLMITLVIYLMILTIIPYVISYAVTKSVYKTDIADVIKYKE